MRSLQLPSSRPGRFGSLVSRHTRERLRASCCRGACGAGPPSDIHLIRRFLTASASLASRPHAAMSLVVRAAETREISAIAARSPRRTLASPLLCATTLSASVRTSAVGFDLGWCRLPLSSSTASRRCCRPCCLSLNGVARAVELGLRAKSRRAVALAVLLARLDVCPAIASAPGSCSALGGDDDHAALAVLEHTPTLAV